MKACVNDVNAVGHGSFDGFLGISNNPSSAGRISYGVFHVEVGSNRSSPIQNGAALFEFDCFRYNVDYGHCVQGTSINTFGTIAFPISGDRFFIQVDSGTTAAYGDVADFANTARLFLRLPDGVSITSDSGTLLAEAQPIFSDAPPAIAIPEPPITALLVGGAMLGLNRTRRIGQRTKKATRP